MSCVTTPSALMVTFTFACRCPLFSTAMPLAKSMKVEEADLADAVKEMKAFDAAGLTAAQFEKGRELGEQFWLYVVERTPAGFVEQKREAVRFVPLLPGLA